VALAPPDLALHPQLTDAGVGEPQPIRGHRGLTLVERFRAADSYGILLVLILASLVATAAASGSRWGRVVALVGLGGTLLYAMWTSRAGHRLRRAGWVLVPIMVVSAAIPSIASDAPLERSIVSAVSAVLVLSAAAAVLSRLRTHSKISIQTVLGALCIYLLIGLFFSSIYSMIASASGDPFFAQGAPAATSVNYVYFSFVTLATVGYGDLSAAGDLGKMLAASEGLIGQLFLVTVVALVVSNIGKTRHVVAEETSSDDVTPTP
jgi:Ion channel